MSVRPRKWITSTGEERKAWVVDYTDQEGNRCQETFKKQKDAKDRHDQVGTAKQVGTLVAPSRSITVKQAAEAWLAACESGSNPVTRGTVTQYRQHVNLHILPLIGRNKLTDLTALEVSRFEQNMSKAGASAVMVKKVKATLSTILSHAMMQGRIGRNIVKDIGRQNGKRKRKADQKRKLKAGVDIPTPAEISAILVHAADNWRPLLLVAAYTGLRASEVRALRWSDCSSLKADKGEVSVCQRADKWGNLDKTKSEAGDERKIPVGKVVMNTLRGWKLRCPKSELDLVFPTKEGTVRHLENIVRRGYHPAQIKAGIVKPDGTPKYSGFHALRHFYASWCINRKVDGGRELPPKTVQERLGHSSIMMTLDTYGHLFPAGDDAEIDDAELALLHATQCNMRA